MATNRNNVEILGSWSSPYANRVQMALNLKSVEYEFIEENLTSNKSRRLLEANPVHKKIPVLIHGDKRVCESLVIVEYIDEVWSGSGPSILPSDPYDRAIARFWASYISDQWWPTIVKKLKKASSDEARTAIIGRVFEGVMLLEEAFMKCSKGKAFFGGDNVGYVDIVLGSYLGWINVMDLIEGGLKLFDAIKTPGLAGWALRFRAHSVAKDGLPPPDKLIELYKSTTA